MATRRPTWGRVAALLVVAGLTAACGDDADDEASSGGDGPAEVTSTAPADAGGGDCAGTDLTVTDAATGAAVELTSTAAVSLEGGAAYTAYGADFELDAEEISLFASPTVPADGTMATLAITVFNAEEDLAPLEAGQVVRHDMSELGILTFVVTVNQGEELLGNNSGGAGELTLTAVGDTLCVEVDYADEEKSLTGTLEAPVEDL